jgi:hypothetical protein
VSFLEKGKVERYPEVWNEKRCGRKPTCYGKSTHDKPHPVLLKRAVHASDTVRGREALGRQFFKRLR